MTITAAELASRASMHNVPRVTERLALSFLREWQARGIAEEIAGRWRLTRTGRSMFSAWVSNLEPVEDGRDA